MPNQFSHSEKERFFDTDHLKANLKQQSVRSGIVTIIAQAAKFILQMGSTVVLARLLVPEDYGLIGMVKVLIGFAELFKDLGLSKAVIQKAQITHQQVSTLFWINVVISCLIALIIVTLSPLIASFYQEPRLVGITMALATGFIFGGLTVQHKALLERQMHFTSLAKVEIISGVIGVVVAIAFARMGAGYWSLVWMQIATSVAIALGVWICCPWRPGKPVRESGVGSLLKFGGHLTGFNIVNYFSRNLDNILIGRYWGSQQLGLYEKAYQLVLLPVTQINFPVTSIAIPVLSSLQFDSAKYCRYYYKAMLLLASLGMPLVGFLLASADQVILLLLGEQWLGAVPIFQFLMPAAFNATIGVGMGWAYQSLNRVDRQLRWGIVSSAINAILFVIGVQWGAIGVAAAYGLSRPFFIVAGFLYCFQGTPLKVSKLIRVLSQPALASIGATFGLMGINHLLLSGVNNVIGLLVDLIVYTLSYVALWMITPNGRQTFWDLLKIIKKDR